MAIDLNTAAKLTEGALTSFHPFRTLMAQLPVATLSTAAHPLGFPLLAQGDLHGALGALLALGYGAAIALVWATSRSLWAVFMLPAYWCLHVAALVMALHDVVRCPQHWFKTSHGLAARPALAPTPSLAVALQCE